MIRQSRYVFISVLSLLFVVCECTPDLKKLNSTTSRTSRGGIASSILSTVGLENYFKSEDDLINEGNDFFRQTKYREAVQMFSRAIKKNPAETTYYIMRANCHWKLNDLSAVLTDYKEVVKIEGKSQQSEKPAVSDQDFLTLGKALYSTEKYEGAAWCYTQAIRQRPLESLYYRLRAECNIELKKWDSTILDLKKAIQLNPRNRTNCDRLFAVCGGLDRFYELTDESLKLPDKELARIGDDLKAKQKIGEAINLYSAAINQNSNNPSYYEKRGYCYILQENYYMAINDYKAAVHLDPLRLEARDILNKILLRLGRLDEAIQEALSSRIPDKEFIRTLGNELCSQEKFEEAIQLYTDAINKCPWETSYYRLRIDLYLQLGHSDKAIEDLRRVIGQTNPVSQDDRNRLVELLLDTEKYEEAIEETRRNAGIYLVDPILSLGEELTRQNKFEKAIKLYTKSLKKNPSEVSYYRLRSHCHSELKNFDLAVQDLRSALQLVPNNESDSIRLCEILFAAEKYDEAIAEVLNSERPIIGSVKLATKTLCSLQKYEDAFHLLEELIRKNPSVAEYYRSRSLCYETMENWNMAIQELRTALEMDRENKNDRLHLSEILIRCEKYNEAVEEILLTDDDSSIAMVGTHFMKSDRYEEAVRCYSEAISKRPEKEGYYETRGNCYLKLENWDLAVADFQKIQQMNPLRPGVQHYLRRLALDVEKLKQAVAQTLTSEKPNEELIKLLGEELRSRSKFKEVIELYTQAIEKNPSQASYYTLRSEGHEKLRDFDSAMQDLREALKLEPKNETVRVRLGRLLLNSLKYEEAVEEIILSNDEPELIKLGDELFESDRPEEAVRCYTEIIKTDPLNETYYEKRAKCYWSLSKLDEAILDFVKILEFDPHNINVLIELSEILVEAERCEDAEEGLQLARKNVDRQFRHEFMARAEIEKIQYVRQKLEAKRENQRVEENTNQIPVVETMNQVQE